MTEASNLVIQSFSDSLVDATHRAERAERARDDMLAALTHALSAIENAEIPDRPANDELRSALPQIRAAIAKARGS